MADITLIPRDVLFGNPDKTSALISPDGKRIAYLAPVAGVLNVWVGTAGGDDFKPITNDQDRGIHVHFWADDARHVLYLQDVAGDENSRLFSVDLDSGKEQDLTPFKNVQVQIVGQDKHFPHELLIGMNKEDTRVHDVYHLDLNTKRLKLIAKNPGNVAQWVVDAKLQVRGALRSAANGGFDLLLRDSTRSDWQKFLSWSADDSLSSGPVAFTRDGKALYLLDSRDANAARLVQVQIASQGSQVIAEDPEYDISDVMVHPDTREIQMVSLFKARIDHIVVDQTIKEDIERISKLRQGDFYICNRTHDDNIWLVGFTEDDGPSSYYAYNRRSKEAKFLFYNRPDLRQYELASMEPFLFETRDGMSVHGYLHFPLGRERRRLPTVLKVHGGPWDRDIWGYDAEAQWFANRGYVCMQVNFRGSRGYGKAFLSAGDKEWGGTMQNDLVDAIRWAVDQGFADSERVGIYGRSYGGYAALAGATFTPDLFKCAVDIVGPSNLITFINTIPPYWFTYLAMLHKRVGNPETEAAFLKSRSPLFHVNKIKIPMLIAHGANDPRVKQSESEQIVAAMKEKGIDCEYILFHDEGHGFVKPANRLKFYAVAEKLLANHLGGRIEN
jgi:dipeptidyl aminopeptidase/acylaminoacyl peptidase